MEAQPRIPSATNTDVYREYEMSKQLPVEKFDEYRCMTLENQLVIAHMVLSGANFDEAKRLVTQNPSD